MAQPVLRRRGSLRPRRQKGEGVVRFSEALESFTRGLETGERIKANRAEARMMDLRAQSLDAKTKELSNQRKNIDGFNEWAKTDEGSVFMAPPEFLTWYEGTRKNPNPMIRAHADKTMAAYRETQVTGPTGAERGEVWISKLRSGELEAEDFQRPLGVLATATEVAEKEAEVAKITGGKDKDQQVRFARLSRIRRDLLSGDDPLDAEDPIIINIDRELAEFADVTVQDIKTAQTVERVEALDKEIEAQQAIVDSTIQRATSFGVGRGRGISQGEQARIDNEKSKLQKLERRRENLVSGISATQAAAEAGDKEGFASETEARAAGFKNGDIVVIGGQRGILE